MGTFPERNQQAPDYWDDELKGYIDDKVPPGGSTGQVLTKMSNATDEIHWATPSGGGGAVDSVNGQTGVVVLDSDDIGDGATKVQMTTAERAKLGGVATGATANSTDAQLRDRATHTGVQAQSTVTGLVAALGAKADLVGGLVPTAQIPPLAISEVFTVADQAAMLALTAQRGDVAVRTDNGKTFILSTDSPGTLADWKEIMAVGAVQSVAGKTGVVALAKADVGLSNVDNTSDANKPISTATQTALDGKLDGINDVVNVTVPLTQKVLTVNIVDDGSATTNWVDRFEFLFDPLSGAARRTTYLNEYGETRISPAKADTVPCRLFTRELLTDPVHTAGVPIIEVMDDRVNRNPQFQVHNDGAVVSEGDGTFTGDVTAANLPPAFLTLTAAAPIPGGTAAGTIVFRTP